MKKCLWVGALVMVVAFAGCQKPLKYEKNFSLTVGNSQHITIDAPKSEQKVVVKVTTAEAAVHVFVALAKDVPADADADPATIKNLLGSQKNTKDGSVNVTIPAGEKFVVIVVPVGKTNVTVKIDSV